MKYRNASEILPDPLLKELQKYAGGETLYVPAAGERRAWGEGSGSRRYYAERNEEIRQNSAGASRWMPWRRSMAFRRSG